MPSSVIVGTEMTGLSPRSIESVPDAPPKPATLEEELAVRGILVYPREKVRQFQKRHLRAEKRAGRAGPLATWERLSLQEFNWRNQYSDVLMPPDVKKTVAEAKTIPRTEVFVERFEEDPFVFIERRRKNFKTENPEVCCIGYWDAPGFKP